MRGLPEVAWIHLEIVVTSSLRIDSEAHREQVFAASWGVALPLALRATMLECDPAEDGPNCPLHTTSALPSLLEVIQTLAGKPFPTILAATLSQYLAVRMRREVLNELCAHPTYDHSYIYSIADSIDGRLRALCRGRAFLKLHNVVVE